MNEWMNGVNLSPHNMNRTRLLKRVAERKNWDHAGTKLEACINNDLSYEYDFPPFHWR